MATSKRNYHDGTLLQVRFSGSNVTLIVELNPHWNNQNAERCCLFFYDVKNIDELRLSFHCGSEDTECFPKDEIIGILKSSNGEFLVDLVKTGPVTILCHGMSET
jgi:hypothetical protein